jgi:hypothetical protein
MRYSNRLFLYLPFIILLIIAAVVVIHWRGLEEAWQARLVAANRGREIAPGVTLHFASEDIEGFPFNIDVVFDNIVLSVQSTRGPISFASEHFAIHSLTYGRVQQVMEAAGQQTLTWTDAEGGMHRFQFLPGSLRASAIERDGQLVRFDLDLNEFGSHFLTGERAQLHLRTAPDRNALEFALSADDIHHSGASVPHMDVEGHLMPARSLLPLLSAHDEWRRALSDWRDTGGTLRLDNVDIAWGASRLTGTAALGLDDTHRINGEANLLLSGARQWTPTRLTATPFISALQNVTRTSPSSSASAIPLKVDIHNGAAIVTAARSSRAAGTLDPVF